MPPKLKAEFFPLLNLPIYPTSQKHGFRQDQEKSDHVCTSLSSQVPFLIIYFLRPPTAATQSPPKKTRSAKTAATIPEEPDQMDVAGELSDKGPSTPSAWSSSDQGDSDAVALKCPTKETATGDAAEACPLTVIENPVATPTNFANAVAGNQVVPEMIAIIGAPANQATPIAVTNPGALAPPLQNGNQAVPNDIHMLPVGMVNAGVAAVQHGMPNVGGNPIALESQPDKVTAQSHPILAPILERVNKALRNPKNIGIATGIQWSEHSPVYLAAPRAVKTHFWFYGTFVMSTLHKDGAWGVKIQFLLMRDAVRANDILANMSRPAKVVSEDKIPYLWMNYRNFEVKSSPPPLYDCIESGNKANRKALDFKTLKLNDVVLVEAAVRRFLPSDAPKVGINQWTRWNVSFEISAMNLIARSEGEVEEADDDF
ncbi:hypothetical protein NLI96_g6810 [Meripilus lineatus]|uniref:Uncharacterized protein n=1 Tax=Meripilus lineatus TaxID=2056292 RepID=A0AAD5V090_9APHY|nr:hypothetical protein NLI96_g6810 [Physisporinus lineatus]